MDLSQSVTSAKTLRSEIKKAKWKKRKDGVILIMYLFYKGYHCELYDWSENKLFVFVFVFVFVKHSQNHPGLAEG